MDLKKKVRKTQRRNSFGKINESKRQQNSDGKRKKKNNNNTPKKSLEKERVYG